MTMTLPAQGNWSPGLLETNSQKTISSTFMGHMLWVEWGEHGQVTQAFLLLSASH